MELKEDLKSVGPNTRNVTFMTEKKINTIEEYFDFCNKLEDETIYNGTVSCF